MSSSVFKLQDIPAHPQTVLIVEDDDQIAYLLEYLFTREGFHVNRVADGKQAQQVIVTSACPDLVMMDINLPYVNGFDLVREIRARPDWANVAVVMLTTMHEEKDIVHSFDVGVDEFISKPFQPRELMARVRKILR